MKKGILTACAALIATGMMMSTSFAAHNATVKVMKATAKPSGVAQVQLVKPTGNTCCAETNCWYIAPAGSDDQTLAVALTAMSLGSDVRIGIDSTSTTSSTSCVLVAIGLEAE